MILTVVQTVDSDATRDLKKTQAKRERQDWYTVETRCSHQRLAGAGWRTQQKAATLAGCRNWGSRLSLVLLCAG